MAVNPSVTDISQTRRATLSCILDPSMAWREMYITRNSLSKAGSTVWGTQSAYTDLEFDPSTEQTSFTFR